MLFVGKITNTLRKSAKNMNFAIADHIQKKDTILPIAILTA